MCLFTAQPSLADQVPPLGHIPRIFERMNSDNDAIPKACVEVVNVLAGSEVCIFVCRWCFGGVMRPCIFLPQFCVRTMAKTQVVKPLIAAMKRRRDCIHQAVETVSKMYENTNPELISQVKNNGCTTRVLLSGWNA